ncbi:MAG: PEP-CTERM sorting domain-containing protein [Rubrivivax sp.]
MFILKPMLCALAVAGVCIPAQATTRIAVSFDDPGALYGRYYADIERTTVAAGSEWLSHFALVAPGAELSVRVGFASIATANGRSASSAFVWTDGDGVGVFEQGAAHELRTGIDINGESADIEFNLGIDGYLQDELWFDPDPAARLASVPADRTDAVSVMLHEFGHALGFNGWRHGLSGDLAGNYQSTFDAWVRPYETANGTVLQFHGAAALLHHGAPVPLTYGNYAHLGNLGSASGADLVPDLMNGIVFYRGTRYDISALDLRILHDIGLPVTLAVPEPGTFALWLAGLGLLAAARRGSRRPTAGVRPRSDGADSPL